MPRVILISPGQPSLNPRLVKEADALSGAGYEVTVLYAYWNEWGSQLDKELLLQKKWRAIRVGGDPNERTATYFLSRITHKLARWLFKTSELVFFAEFATARSSWFLTREAKKHRADLYIGHNLGALPAVVKAAYKYHAKCGFDAEDFHRHEISDSNNSFSYKIVKCLEDKYYTSLDYHTASSPQIAAAYQQLYAINKPVTILNVFPRAIHNEKKTNHETGPIKLFWFSQTIGFQRGIEDIVKALSFFKAGDFELHLLGYIDKANKKFFIDNALENMVDVHFYEPIPPDEITGFASQFDVGLALEPGFCTNNNIALSNKLFSYLQAGLAIIASDTIAQSHFLKENPVIGKVYERDNIHSLVAILSTWKTDRGLLLSTRDAALIAGREKLNWENECLKFLSLVNKTLNKVE